ncbi:MAG: hypothetical protein ABIH92_03165 [Nanoarchaeota archaeon]
MISPEKFYERFKWLSEVSGSLIRKGTIDALWEELRNCDSRDFELALKDIAYSDEKVNLGNTWRHLMHHQTVRLEREALEFKRKEDDEFQKWWKDHQGSRQTCVNDYNCYNCKRIYCDIIGKDAIRCIKDVFLEEMQPKEMEQILSKYKGMGWLDKSLEPF